MSRWYQNLLTGEQVEVKTLEADDFYVKNRSNWSRIAPPPAVEAVPSEAPAVELVDSPVVVTFKRKQSR